MKKDVTKWEDDDTKGWKLLTTSVSVHELLHVECR